MAIKEMISEAVKTIINICLGIATSSNKITTPSTLKIIKRLPHKENLPRVYK